MVAIAAGLDHTCCLASDGGVWCWGDNAMGQLGTGVGSRGIQKEPVAVTLATGKRMGKHRQVPCLPASKYETICFTIIG